MYQCRCLFNDYHGNAPVNSSQLSLLPSQISFNRLPLGAPREEGKPLSLARREVFDIRTQLMAEDSVDGEDNGELIAGLEEGDLKPNFYEGGFKTWECALDLARLVVDDENSEIPSPAVQNDSEDFHVIEVSDNVSSLNILISSGTFCMLTESVNG